MRPLLFRQNRFFSRLLLCVLITLLYASTTQANIFIDRNILVFPAHQRPIQNLKVTNGDSNNTTLVVQTEVYEVFHSGTEKAETLPSKAMAVAPSSFELVPKQERNVRILLREPNTAVAERVFRINFLPRRPDRSVARQEAGQNTTDGPKLKLNMFVGMGTLIFVLPREIDYRFEHKRDEDGKVVHFTNHGNVSVHLQPRTICHSSDEKVDTCFRFSGQRIYPGTSFSYQVPSGFESSSLAFSIHSAGRYFGLEVPLSD